MRRGSRQSSQGERRPRRSRRNEPPASSRPSTSTNSVSVYQGSGHQRSNDDAGSHHAVQYVGSRTAEHAIRSSQTCNYCYNGYHCPYGHHNQNAPGPTYYTTATTAPFSSDPTDGQTVGNYCTSTAAPFRYHEHHHSPPQQMATDRYHPPQAHSYHQNTPSPPQAYYEDEGDEYEDEDDQQQQQQSYGLAIYLQQPPEADPWGPYYGIHYDTRGGGR